MDESYLRAWGKEGYCLGLKISDRLHAQRRQRTWQSHHRWGGPTVCGGTIDSVQMLSEAFRRGVDCG